MLCKIQKDVQLLASRTIYSKQRPLTSNPVWIHNYLPGSAELSLLVRLFLVALQAITQACCSPDDKAMTPSLGPFANSVLACLSN